MRFFIHIILQTVMKIIMKYNLAIFEQTQEIWLPHSYLIQMDLYLEGR